jgi:hypothetical protein
MKRQEKETNEKKKLYNTFIAWLPYYQKSNESKDSR